MDCGHFSIGKVHQYHATATNIPHYNYTKLPIVQRSNTPDYLGCASSKSLKVKRNKSSSAADACRGVETRRLLAERHLDVNRSNPMLWSASEEQRRQRLAGRERRSGSHPSLSAPLLRPALPCSPAPSAPARSARSSTWCCGSFVKQLTKSHHFD